MEMNQFIDGLMARMTLEEKIGQLNLAEGGGLTTGTMQTDNRVEKICAGQIGGVLNIASLEDCRKAQEVAVTQSRLGIPLIMGLDVIHGYYKGTIFPIPLALSCTWNVELIEATARVAAVEATASGNFWFYSPMVDICRDPRWGRIAEGSGEDAFLGARIAEAMVRGYQGSDPDSFAADEGMACVKHGFLYGGAEGGRDYNTVDMSPQRMHDAYFGPYEAAVRAGAGSLMTSFNDVNGMPSTANRELMTDLLRDRWGFKGFVVTDYTAVLEMMKHGLAETGEDPGTEEDHERIAVKAINAGTDMEMVGETFLRKLPEAVAKGLVSEATIDTACRRILEAKWKLGLFEDPYRYFDAERERTQILTPDSRALARRAVQESAVLLKNDTGVLPLGKTGKIAVIGPLADDKANMPGMWSLTNDGSGCSTVLEGLRDVCGEACDIVYARGADITDDPVMETNCNALNHTRSMPTVAAHRK